MKKLLALMMAAALCLTCTAALAEDKTYTDPDGDFSFVYDDACFEITSEDHADDDHLVILDGKVEAWGEVSVSFYLTDIDEDEGDAFPVIEDFDDMETDSTTTIEQGEWNGFQNVIMYDITDEEENVAMQSFIVPLYDDDDNEVDDMMMINVTIDRLDDEETGMQRDDAISAMLDSLKILDD